jgi:hypothetical protein
MMVCYIKNYWVSELCPVSSILKGHNVLERNSVSILRRKGREASTLFGPLERVI